MSTEMLGLILAGGKGTRLGKLTSDQAKPAVPFGGRYRIIDFTLSNCANSGVKNIGIITQYQPLLLNEHIGNGVSWGLDGLNASATILQPYTDNSGSKWFEGTAHAIYQNIDYIDSKDPEYVLILSGDHIYKMDYESMLEEHIKNGASLTVAVIDVPMKEASRFGIMNTDVSGRITEFEEKPEHPKSNHASMGIYIFNWKRLREVLTTGFTTNDDMVDFGKNVIPYYLKSDERVFAYHFSGYWKDVGTIDSLWEANMDLLKEKQPFEMNGKWKIYSVDMAMPPHYVGPKAKIKNSLVSEGSMICGEVKNSVIFPGVRIAKGAKVSNSVIMPFAKIEADAVVEKAIVAQNSKIEATAQVGSDDGTIVVIPEGETVRPMVVSDATENVNVG